MIRRMILFMGLYFVRKNSESLPVIKDGMIKWWHLSSKWHAAFALIFNAPRS